MPTNDFKPFATAGGANVSTQAEYLALAALSTGWQSGKASSKEVNKAVRQATFIAAALAQFVSDKGAVDVLDDGNLAGFGTNLIAALNQTSQPLDATLTALAALVGAANKLPYFNGADTAALTDLTQVGRDIIGKADVAAVLTYLGLSQVAKKDANNIFSGSNTFNGGTALSANTTLDGIGLVSAIDGKQPSDATLTALAGLATGANKLPYFTGADAAGLADLSAFIRTMLGKTDAAATRTYLGLGNASQRDVGTANGQIPDMSAWTRGGPGTARWRKSPDGLIEQWGSAGVGDAFGHAVVSFPIAFSSAPDGVFFGPRNVSVPDKITGITLDESKLSNTGFECRCLDQLDASTTPSTSNFYWFARGY